MLLCKGRSYYQHFQPQAESHTFGVSDKSFGAIFAMLLAIESEEVIRQALGLAFDAVKSAEQAAGELSSLCLDCSSPL